MVAENTVRKILITGGMRSGKSAFALELARGWPANKLFLATAQSSDPEMESRIEKHKKERSPDFQTIEEPIDLGNVIKREGGLKKLIIIDCLTLWINNLLFTLEKNKKAREEKKQLFLENVQETESSLIVITNEVGWGVIPDNALGRLYVEELGLINRQMALCCSEMYLMVAGLPQRLKPVDQSIQKMRLRKVYE